MVQIISVLILYFEDGSILFELFLNKSSLGRFSSIEILNLEIRALENTHDARENGVVFELNYDSLVREYLISEKLIDALREFLEAPQPPSNGFSFKSGD